MIPGSRPLIATGQGEEAARVAALRASGLLDTAPEVAFDDIARLAGQLCATPFAMVAFVDAERTWFKAQVGFTDPETPRDVSLCALALDGPLIAEDTLANPRFAGYPMVAGPPYVRFFAGVPLLTADGHAIGALCVGDIRPRSLSPEQEYGLHALARAATHQIDLHRHARAVETLLSERTALFHIAELVGGVADITERLRRICGVLARLTGADTASAYMLDAGQTILRPVAGYHVPKWALTGLAQTPIPAATEGFAEAALRQRRVVWSDDVAHDPRFPQAIVEKFPHRSGAVVPLVVDEAVAGGFYLTWWERARTVTDTEAALLETVGLHTGIFLRSARLHTELEARNQRLRTLIELNQAVSSTLDAGSTLAAIARAAERLIDVNHVMVWTADERRQRLTLVAASKGLSKAFPLTELPYDQGAIGWVATHRQILKLDDIHAEGSPIIQREWWRGQNTSTFLGVPVMLDGELLAVLSMNGRRPFLRQPGERDLIDLFAAQTAAALRNASLHAEALAAREVAEAAARAKSDFLAMMSHELRTPLTGVVGVTELLRATALGPEQRELVETLQQSTEALRSVVGDILDFAKIEAGKFEADAVAFEVDALVEATIDGHAHAAEMKGLDLAAVTLPEIGTVVGERDRIRQVLANLVANAVKFTDRGQVMVRATTRERDERVELTVEVVDSGIGIAPDEQRRLFEPYSQVDLRATRHQESTGLGLAICKRLVEAMGGRIGVDSGPGRGSTFWFTVPVMPSAGLRDAGAERSISPARVLLVESGRATRECIEAYLAAWGVPCVSVGDGAQGLAALREAWAEDTPFHVAILGRRLGSPGPEELAAAIKTTPSLAAVALVGLRPLGDPTRAGGGLWAATLRTPVHRRALGESLERALAPREGDTQAPEPAENPSPACAPLHLHVLVAEDNRTSQTVASLMLRALGCEADIVGNGPAAVAAAESGSYDVILMDCNMPSMDGLVATREIRRQAADGRRIPIIAVTASASKGDREQCLEAGMDDYLSKPITIEALRTALVRAVRALPALDESRLADLRVQGQRDLCAELVRAFLAESAALVASFREAVNRRDPVAVARIAHRIRGASREVGAQEIAALAAEVEQIGDDGTPAGLDSYATQLDRALARARAALESILPSL